MKKETKHEAAIRHLSDLDLSQYVGNHKDEEVVILEDSGYGNRRIQEIILTRGWGFVFNVNGWKKRKQREFRTRGLTGCISGLTDEVRLVLSEERGSRRGRKYLVCSNLGGRMGVIVRIYRERWKVELFHKDIKSLLGYEDVSFHDFQSMEAHVHRVCCAWLLLPEVSGKF